MMTIAQRCIDRFWLKTAKREGGCWEHPFDVNTAGYGRHWTFKPKGRWLAHRFSWTVTNGVIPDGMKVLHKCDNRLCVRPDHLFLGTETDNMIDRAMKGKQNTSHLSHDDVVAIRDLRATTDLLDSEIAKRYGVSAAAVRCIGSGKTWPALPGPRTDKGSPAAMSVAVKRSWTVRRAAYDGKVVKEA